MSRPDETSTSTRDAAPWAVLKNRRRTEPRTSTTSSTRQLATDLRARPDHTAAVDGVDRCRDRRPVVGLGTTTRNVQSVSPLGRTRSSGGWETRPTSRTSLTASAAWLLC